ncbi:MAG: helix-turn-helix transcriptional regulator [Clostridia bacterium]|nr:helix-turn-helix transcriptional regulator [Clostridia bacterium]
MSYTIGEKLQVIMKRKGLTVTELARLTHQSRQNLSRKLNLNLMTVQELSEYAEILGCRVDILLTMNDTNEQF